MPSFTTFQDSDFDSASTFGFMHGRTNASDYVEMGMEFSVDFQTPSLVVGNGKAFVLLPEEEDSQKPGTYRTRVSKGVETDLIENDRTFQLQSNAANYVWLVSQASTENDGAEQDQPFFTVNQSGDDPDPRNGTLLIGIVDTVSDTPNPINRNPDIGAETVEVDDDIDLGGDLSLLGEQSTVQIGEGSGPHEIRFGGTTEGEEPQDPLDGFTLRTDSDDQMLRLRHEENTGAILSSSREGDVAFPKGSVGVGTQPQSPTFGQGTTLNVVETNESQIAEVSVHGEGQGSGLVYVGQDDGYGGGFAYNGNDVPDMPTGKDNFSLFHRIDGEDHELLWWGIRNDAAHFEGEIHMEDNSMRELESLHFEADPDQAIYYTGNKGEFAIRDKSNDGDRVLSVGQGQMKINRTINMRDNYLTNIADMPEDLTFQSGHGIADARGGRKAFEIIPRVPDIPDKYGSTEALPQPEGTVISMDDYVAFTESDSSDLKAYIDTGRGGKAAPVGGRGVFEGQVVAGALTERREYYEELAVVGDAVVTGDLEVEGEIKNT